MKNDILLVQEGKYLMYKEKRFNGIVRGYDENINLKSREEYKEGMLEGLSKTWYPNGMVETERNYHAGDKVGIHRGWWQNGNSRFEYHFSKGLYDGEFKEWYENGKPLNIFIYSMGTEEKAIGWRENGKTYINFVVRDGRKYGLTNARLCYSLKSEEGIYKSVNQ